MIKHKPNQYGYRRNSKGAVVEDEAEQAVIKEMFEQRDRANMGPVNIASWLDALGHRPRRGARWTAGSVRNILERIDEESGETARLMAEAQVVFERPKAGASMEPFTCEDGSVISIPVGSAETLRRTGHVVFEDEPYVDFKTHKIKRGDVGDFTVDTFKDLEAKRLAEARLTVTERAERIKFEDPQITPTFGVCLEPDAISPAVMSTTAVAMADLQGLIDLIQGQPKEKADIRQEVKHLFNELAAERQFHLHLLDRLEREQS